MEDYRVNKWFRNEEHSCYFKARKFNWDRTLSSYYFMSYLEGYSNRKNFKDGLCTMKDYDYFNFNLHYKVWKII